MTRGYGSCEKAVGLGVLVQSMLEAEEAVQIHSHHRRLGGLDSIGLGFEFVRLRCPLTVTRVNEANMKTTACLAKSLQQQISLHSCMLHNISRSIKESPS